MQDSAPRTSHAESTTLPIRFEGVTVVAGSTTVLKGVDLEIAAGGTTVLMGPNGSGKTTLLRLAMGLTLPTSGKVTYAGVSMPPAGARAIVLQKPVMLRRTVAANVELALVAAGRPSSREHVRSILDRAGIGALADRPARRLSGGEQQRLALARALARDPQVLFLDEPTGSLDPAAAKTVEDIIATVAASGVKIVMSTHDVGQARRLAADIVFLAGGHVVERAPSERFFSCPATGEARRFLAGELVL